MNFDSIKKFNKDGICFSLDTVDENPEEITMADVNQAVMYSITDLTERLMDCEPEEVYSYAHAIELLYNLIKIDEVECIVIADNPDDEAEDKEDIEPLEITLDINKFAKCLAEAVTEQLEKVVINEK